MTERSPEPSVAAVVLAAGTSSRMGRNKLLLEIDGEPLVRRAVREALAAGLAPVVVVLGHEAEAVAAALTGLDCVQVVNAGYAEGMTSSLRTGIAALPPSAAAAVVVLADMPKVSSEILGAVVRAHRKTRRPIVVSSYEGVQAPPTLFAREVFHELLELSDDAKPEGVARRYTGGLTVVDQPLEALVDIDLPADVDDLGSG